MFQIESDMTIHITRGDTALFTVTAENEGSVYKFQPGDVVRIKVFAKKNATIVVLQKDFPVLEEADRVDVLLTEEDTKIGEVISKPVDYWYEVELNPFTNPQTIVGYDDDGPKIFKLYPEGRDLLPSTTEEDIPVVDKEFSLTSERPVQNQVVTRAILNISETVKKTEATATEKAEANEKAIAEAVDRSKTVEAELSEEIAVERARISNLATLDEGSTTGDAELIDIRTGASGKVYASAGEAVRGQVRELNETLAGLELVTNVNLSTATSGQFVTTEGVVSSNSEFSTLAIHLKKDEKLQLHASGYQQKVAMIAMDNHSTTGNTPLVVSIDNNRRTYEYTATADIDLLLSYWTTNDVWVKILYNARKTDVTAEPNNYWAYALKNVICIGDSLTAGANFIIDDTGKSINESYPYYLERMLKVVTSNQGKSGYTTQEWYAEAAYNYANYDSAIIWLGTNGGLTDTLETDCVGNDYTQYANTNTGCYCKIIESIKAVNDDCFILLLTPSEKDGYSTTISVIEKISQKYNLPVLSMQGLGKNERPDLHGNLSNIHFGKAGNIFIANRIIEFLGNYFANNPRLADFGETK